ncbi:MAG: CDP-glucose 4,6-dehydratase [Selenomonas ruminantium]|nr:CDP-glucose 4,6-dehydratase [Selenomonas ruminantium]
MKLSSDFYKGKKVLITGHTGFKGMWLTKLLKFLGAEITGYALGAPTEEGERIFRQVGIEGLHFINGDIRDREKLLAVFGKAEPEVVFHLAAQPIVLESYKNPVFTYETNIMGTVNILECVRKTESVKSFLNVTTDKVYENKEWPWGYRENDPLDGYDPYSNSKSCSELVTHSYQRSFFADGRCAISTARAGNVIGGGDFAKNRIVPDCIRAALMGEKIEVRNPHSTRPYQHVLEPLCAYLLVAQAQYGNCEYADWYNVGPDDCDCVTTGQLVDIFCRLWGDGQTWENVSADTPHEANFLKLDCSKIKSRLGWQPRWHIEEAMQKTVNFAKAMRDGKDLGKTMDEQIEEFLRRGL